MAQSMQHKLSRVRPPRVQITYDVETGGAIEKKELAFIVGILADLSASTPSAEPEKALPPVSYRKFVELDRDNFEGVMEKLSPSINLSVKGVLPDATGDFNAALSFTSIDHFHPVHVVRKSPVLNQMFGVRNRLRDFISKTDGNDALYSLLANVLNGKTAGLNAELTAIETALKPHLKKVDEEQAAEEAAKAKLKGKSDKPEDYMLNLENMPLEEVPPHLLQRIPQADLDAAIPAIDPAADTFISRMLEPNKPKGGVGMVLDPSQKHYTLQLIAQYAKSIVPAPLPDDNKQDSPQLAASKIAEIDENLTKQVNLLMHHEKFQTLEATWRGLHYLVMKSETGEKLKLKVLNISQAELLKDLQKAAEFDQSALFKKVYEEEYGTYGGAPYSMLLAAYEFGRHPQDISLLELLSGVAATAHTPLVASAYAKLFDLEDFAELSKPRDLNKIFESAELAKWKEFRETEDSRYVTLALPRVLLRLPYGDDTVPVEEMSFEEDVDGTDAKRYLWGNAAFILTERITNAYTLYGWTAAIRGVEGGGLVEGLPIHVVNTRDGDKAVYCPTQVAITDRREKELNDLGFMAICHCKGSGKAAFFGGQSTNKPRKYISDAANANASISAMLPYILNASRFAHYIKVIMREKVGSFQTRAGIENFLNNWITQYVLLDESAGQESKAAFPLQQGRVIVTEIPGKPGSYKSTVFLKPHFQLEELTASIRLVAEIPA
jgi:type VI secretion system protein ImpC